MKKNQKKTIRVFVHLYFSSSKNVFSYRANGISKLRAIFSLDLGSNTLAHFDFEFSIAMTSQVTGWMELKLVIVVSFLAHNTKC